MEKPFHRFGAAAAVPLFDGSIEAGGGALVLPLRKSFNHTEALRDASLTEGGGGFGEGRKIIGYFLLTLGAKYIY